MHFFFIKSIERLSHNIKSYLKFGVSEMSKEQKFLDQTIFNRRFYKTNCEFAHFSSPTKSKQSLPKISKCLIMEAGCQFI